MMIDSGLTTDRFIAVLNRKVELGRLLNALGHMAAGLTSLYDGRMERMRFQTYTDKNLTEHKSISDNPFIILKADNGNQIRSLRTMLVERDILFTDFADTMVDGGYIEQHERTAKTAEIDINYFGICFFADNKVAKELTKRFSLFL